MPASSATVRSFVLAVFGLGVAPTFAQGQNVTAFNPYSGVGLPGGPTASYGPQAAYPIVDTVGPTGGPAFNPWQPSGPMPIAGGAGAFNPGEPISVGATGPAPVYVYNPGANLPPPPSRIESRLVAIPERGDARIPRQLLYSSPPAPPPAAAEPPPAPAPVAVSAPTPVMPAPAPRPAPTPTPPARTAPPVVPITPPVAAAAPPAAAPNPPAAAPGRAVAVTTAPNVAPAAKGATVATVAFTAQSADLSDVAKSELDRVAKNINDKSMRQVELRAYATGGDPESRKIALARALVVRSYLIDRGVKSRIEVGGFSGGDGERVDILVPNT